MLVPGSLSPRLQSRPSVPGELIFLLSLLVDGALAGALYALIALAFVLVYKSSRMMNFAVGEWIMVAALLVSAAESLVGVGLAGALLLAAAGMAAFGIAFNMIVVQRLASRPAISVIMVTIGLGALMRGSAALILPSGGLRFPVLEPLVLGDISVAPEKLIAADFAAIIVVLVAAVYRYSRTGIMLRAIADDPQAAAAAGINLNALFALLWSATGVISVAAGVLWVLAAGGGFGVSLVGLKIFPIVVIGGFDSLPGTIIAAMLIGIVESLGAGFADPHLGGGSGTLLTYLLMMAMLLARPYGLFGRAPATRV
jgi:branched-chain amino acid transport system permease protein